MNKNENAYTKVFSILYITIYSMIMSEKINANNMFYTKLLTYKQYLWDAYTRQYTE